MSLKSGHALTAVTMKTFHLLVSSLLSVHTALAFSTHFKHHNFTSTCASVLSQLNIENATVYFSQFVASGTNLSLPENNVTCGQPSHLVPVDMCRVALYVATSERSGVNMETWLPANWTGRYLSSGNGGINGCLDYDVMAYGLQYGFATAGSNNGHNGTSGEPLLNNADSVKDFAWRA
jgi:feruloyl esterase